MRKWLFPFWKIPLDTAKEEAMGEYQEFNKNQKIVSDFDKKIRKIKGDNNEKK